MKSSSLRKWCKVGDEIILTPCLGANAVLKTHVRISFFISVFLSISRQFSCDISLLLNILASALLVTCDLFSNHTCSRNSSQEIFFSLFAAQNVSYLFVRSMTSVLLQVYLNFSFISSFLNVHFLAATLRLVLFYVCR